MATLLELAADIVSSHASASPMSTDDLLQEIGKVYAALLAIESGQEGAAPAEAAVTVKDAFRKNEVICMVCNKGGMKTLTRHLRIVHQMKPGEYRKQFAIPAKQSLTARSYSVAKRKMAMEKGLGDILAKAREAKAAKTKVKKIAAKPAKPAARPAKAKATKAKAK